AEHFAAVYARRYARPSMRLSEDARAALTAHPWPGNVRELEHTIERAVVLTTGDVLDEDALALGDAPDVQDDDAGGADDTVPAPDPADVIALPAGLSLDEAERRYALEAVARAGGNQS